MLCAAGPSSLQTVKHGPTLLSDWNNYASVPLRTLANVYFLFGVCLYVWSFSCLCAVKLLLIILTVCAYSTCHGCLQYMSWVFTCHGCLQYMSWVCIIWWVQCLRGVCELKTSGHNDNNVKNCAVLLLFCREEHSLPLTVTCKTIDMDPSCCFIGQLSGDFVCTSTKFSSEET